MSKETTMPRITPKAEKYARENGLSYDHIKGTGILGAITIGDVKKFGRKAGEVSVCETADGPASDLSMTRRARIVAQRKGWTCDGIKGSGANGEITMNDLKKIGLTGPADAAPVSTYDSTLPDEIRKMTQMQQTICRSMQKSLSGTAQTTTAMEVDITSLVSQYRSIKERYTNAGIKLSYTAMIIKSVAMALEDHPAMRTQPVNDHSCKVIGTDRIDIGCAVDVPDGLVVPVIRNANRKDLRTICLELADISERARSNKLTADDFGGAVLTITNLGMFGATYFTPVLNTPESAILGVGTIVKTVIARNGIMTPGSVLNLSLTHDHRIVNGAPAARFMNQVIDGLRNFRWV